MKENNIKSFIFTSGKRPKSFDHKNACLASHAENRVGPRFFFLSTNNVGS